MIMTLDQIIQREILKRLVETEFNAKRAARSLGIGKTTMYANLKKWDLSPVKPVRVLRMLEVIEGGQ